MGGSDVFNQICGYYDTLAHKECATHFWCHIFSEGFGNFSREISWFRPGVLFLFFSVDLEVVFCPSYEKNGQSITEIFNLYKKATVCDGFFEAGW